MRPFEVSLWKAASYAISTRLSFLTLREAVPDIVVRIGREVEAELRPTNSQPE
jgi:hypothetical protein